MIPSGYRGANIDPFTLKLLPGQIYCQSIFILSLLVFVNRRRLTRLITRVYLAISMPLYIYIRIRYREVLSVRLSICSCSIETTFPVSNFKTKHIFGILMALRNLIKSDGVLNLILIYNKFQKNSQRLLKIHLSYYLFKNFNKLVGTIFFAPNL